MTSFLTRFHRPQNPLGAGPWAPALLVLSCLALSACGPSAPGAGAGAGAGSPPPMPVGVVTVQPGVVGLTTDLPGRLEASRVAQVRARVPGIVQKRLFAEGSEVKAGQNLFQLESASLEASVASAQAALAKAQANLLQAKALADRYQPLVQAKAVSQQDWVSAQAGQKQAEADVAVAQAAVQTARINLGYATLTAPISGRIGRALVTEGALVGQGEATPMALIQQIDPLYVNFTQSANEALQLRRAMDRGQLQRAGQQAARVRVLLEDGSEHPQAGRLLFSDLSVDPTSGQVTLRAEVPNPGGKLLPGLYVRVRLEQAQVPQGVLLPQQAVTRTAQGDLVMVVDAQGKVSPRPVKVGAQQGTQWVVTDGLAAGEQVMVDGFQKLRPGAPVKAVPWPAGAAPVASQPQAASSAPAPAASAASASH